MQSRRNKGKLLRQLRDYGIITIAMILGVISLNLFLLPNEITTGGIMGVASIVYWGTGIPPAEPPAESPKPILMPKNTAPTIQAINFWSASRCRSGGMKPCSMAETTVNTTTPYMVLAQKCHPNTLRATNSSTPLSTKKVFCTGMPVPQ